MKQWRVADLAATLVLAGMAVAIGAAQASPGTAPLPAVISATAQSTRLIQSSVLLSITSTGARLVAVGERGHILLSDDGGENWRQARVPTEVTLTGVRFASATTGWAIGHSGVILHTRDGGETWIRQLDGAQAARLALDSAEAVAIDPRIKMARRWVDDGADKPFLALLALSETKVMAFGAFGLAMLSEDGGKTWLAVDDRLENPRYNHVNAAISQDGRIILAGEQGLLLASEDGGRRFHAIPSPYEGSLFEAILAPGGDILVAGLRGHAYRSGDGGKTWSACPRPIEETIMSGIVLADGRYVLATVGGHLMVGNSACTTLMPVDVPGGGPLAGLALIKDGTLALAGMAGTTRVAIPSLPLEAGK